MNDNIDSMQFGIAAAVISVEKSEINDSLLLFIQDCNNLFSTYSMLFADRHAAASDSDFRISNSSLSKLYSLQSRKANEQVVFYFPKTDCWVYFSVVRAANGCLNLAGTDFSYIQNQLSSYEMQKIGYAQYIENFQGIAYQKLLKPEQKYIFSTGAYEKITGYPESSMKDFSSWLAIVHPEERALVEKEGNALYEEEGYSKELEYRIIRKDGTIRWVHSFDRNFTSGDGTFQMGQGLIVDVTRYKELELRLREANEKVLEQNRKLEELALTDALTGLDNRRAARQVLRFLINDFKRTKECFSILMIDLDHFKNVNDTHGHFAGDLVLKDIAEILSNSLRDNDIKARWGGEEFLVLLPRTGHEAALAISNKILKRVSEHLFSFGSIELSVTFSGGLATYDKPILLDELVNNADEALYKAKNAGRNRIFSHR